MSKPTEYRMGQFRIFVEEFPEGHLTGHMKQGKNPVGRVTQPHLNLEYFSSLVRSCIIKYLKELQESVDGDALTHVRDH